MSNTQAITFKKDEILVLLGAGASVDAGIPHASAMIKKIEEALRNENEWRNFKGLYDYVRSAIFYADGIRGTYANDVTYNIERLVVSLDELARREEHPLYPFIGAWNPRLSQVAGNNFSHVTDFKKKILEKLRHEWIEINNYAKAFYFKGLINFQKEFNYPLRVFTLNYDLCVEKVYHDEYKEFPERGFDQERFWSHELLEEGAQSDKSLYLYKLHGSIDWVRDSNTNKLTYSDSTATIKIDEGELIFGTTYKLQYVDPFLFLVYQLRRYSLEAKLILVIGYGFGDEHINGILQQALRGGPEKRLVAVTWFGDQLNDDEREKAKKEFKKFIVKQLCLEEDNKQLDLQIESAKSFLVEKLSLTAMADYFPAEESLFEDIKA